MTSFESSRRLRDEPQAEISTGRTAHNARAVEWIVRGLLAIGRPSPDASSTQVTSFSDSPRQSSAGLILVT